MSMVTSCPACATTFRITAQQLGQRQGTVRCGKCGGVFDAFKSLTTLPDEAVSAAASSLRPTPVHVSTAGARVRDDGDRVALQGVLDIADVNPDVQVPTSAQEEAAPARTRHAAWRVAIVLFAALLGLQLLYALRDRIAAVWPQIRPALERLCKPLGCTVSFPQRTEQLAIESSDLQTDPQRPGVIVLTAALRNRGRSLVAYPSLELTLTDAHDKAVARRVFQPGDYLADPAAAARGMAGLMEIDVRVTLDTGDLRPSGYRLFLFYP